MKQVKIFEKEYDGESLYDLEHDVSECMCNDYNPLLKELPVDEWGFPKGNFVVTIVWTEEE